MDMVLVNPYPVKSNRHQGFYHLVSFPREFTEKIDSKAFHMRRITDGSRKLLIFQKCAEATGDPERNPREFPGLIKFGNEGFVKADHLLRFEPFIDWHILYRQAAFYDRIGHR